MTTFEKLAKRIYRDTGVVLFDFKRTYRSNNMASAGCFSWFAKRKDGLEVGSESTASELLSRKEELRISSNRSGSSVIF